VATDKSKAAPAKAANFSSKSDKSDAKAKPPPFIWHWKVTKEPDLVIYKLGNTKVWLGETWHFCDCPNHRNRVKWHT
jgi:hypothetical protein